MRIYNNFIGGGLTNIIEPSAYGVIAGGWGNKITDSCTGILGGESNQINAGWSAIAGGRNNNASSVSAFIGGGDGNTINLGADCSAIAGGETNSIAAAAANNSFIGGGKGNTITGSFNAILGGQGNNDSGLAGVMIAGNSITAAIPNALHVNGLWVDPTTIPSFPGFPSLFTPGTVYVDTTPGSGQPLRLA